MKQKDLMTIIGVAVVSGIFAVLLSSLFITSGQNRSQKAEVVQPITSDFPDVNEKYFNGESVNPTQLIRIGDTANPSPFDGN